MFIDLAYSNHFCQFLRYKNVIWEIQVWAWTEFDFHNFWSCQTSPEVGMIWHSAWHSPLIPSCLFPPLICWTSSSQAILYQTTSQLKYLPEEQICTELGSAVWYCLESEPNVSPSLWWGNRHCRLSGGWWREWIPLLCTWIPFVPAKDQGRE